MIESKIKSFVAGGIDPSELSFFLTIDHLRDDRWEEYNSVTEDDQLYPIKLDAKLLHKHFVIISHEDNYVVDGWESIKDIILTKIGGSGHLSKFDYFLPEFAMKIMTDILDSDMVRAKFMEGLETRLSIH